jgi:hypothetical protein
MPSARAVLVVLCLATLSVAAPAPLPRPKRTADPHPWGEPAGGLSARLMPAAKRFPAGTPVRLFLELQNVGGAELRLLAPDLPPFVRFPDDPEASGWSLTGERLGGGGNRESTSGCAKAMEAECVRLAPGETFRVEITLTDDEEALKQPLQEEGEERKARMYFPGKAGPGTYEFRATFRRHARRKDVLFKEVPGVWRADRLDSPPVRVELE